MKKIFGMFAMAAVAATTLTCCGGGAGTEDGTHSFAYKTVTYRTSETLAGTMVIRVYDKTSSGSNTYNADISFGENGKKHQGIFQVVDNSESPTVTMHVDGNESFDTDTGVLRFYASLGLPEDLQAGDAVYGFPRPTITMDYTNNAEGLYTATFEIFIGDNPDTEDITETDYYITITNRPGIFSIEG